MSDSYEMGDWSTGAQCVFERIAEKWTLHVVARLIAGPTHFLALQRSLGGISKKVLTETLRRLERDGLVTRRPEPHQPTVEYSLTPLGESLAGPLDALRRWSEDHEAVVEDARQRFDAARAARASTAARSART
jgi:DNA-binding HxlR family transcriptional regulator